MKKQSSKKSYVKTNYLKSQVLGGHSYTINQKNH